MQRREKPGLFARVTVRLGGLPARHVSWALVLMFTAWVVVDVFMLRLSGGLARSSYDAMVRARVFAAAPDPRIVIIDIDEASLLRMSREFGRWPWPRDTLASVLEHVEKQQPLAVVWDIVFSDADRLSPGGDAAFNAAVERSTHSHFSVVRLPEKNDALSQITRRELPGLWLPATASLAAGPTSTVALLTPALPAVAAGRMGYNNGYVDNDGVLRRFRYAETLADGSIIQSLPLSVANSVNSATSSGAAYPHSDWSRGSFSSENTLFSWRKTANIYPLVAFADVFAQADGGTPLQAVPSFAGKVVIMGATAPSLHDVHPTPLSPLQAGVDSLATAIDNGLNNRHVAELPRWLQALLAVALCVGIALWVRVHSVASLAPALLLLPACLLGISYLSLNGSPVFVDLNLAAGLGLIFLAALRFWNSWRRQYWSTYVVGDVQADAPQPVALWCWRSTAPWLDAKLDRLIDAIEKHAPNCRIITPDVQVHWPAAPNWPELAVMVAIVGPAQQLQAAQGSLTQAIYKISKLGTLQNTAIHAVDSGTTRDFLCATAMTHWAALSMLANQPAPEVASVIDTNADVEFIKPIEGGIP